uniref:Tc3 transposase DNA binding domain-containing protein n=1 Tax=Astyanax mexicanus TaxID=7994 RepID=A0A3B1JN87_ASTMX
MGQTLSDFESGRIVGLREAGWSNRRIGRHLGWSDMVVAQCWQQWITEGTVYRHRGSGCPRNTTDIDSTPLTTFQASGGIKGNHSETTGRRWYKEPMSSKTSTTDPTSLAVSTVFLPTSGKLECDRLEACDLQ